MVSRDAVDAADAWAELPPGGRASLQQALVALRSGGLAVGSALTGPDGAVVAAGRNRAHDPPGGDDPLQRTPLAHAELNALARVHTSRDLARDVLWSTQQPCSMCDAAAVFTGVGAIRWLSPDPWAVAVGVDRGCPDDGVRRTGPGDGGTSARWLVLSSAMFVASVTGEQDGGDGGEHPTAAACRRDDPAVHRLVEVLRGRRDEHGPSGAAGWAASLPRSAEELAAQLWADVDAAASARSRRAGG